jgi:hypothetical protein
VVALRGQCVDTPRVDINSTLCQIPHPPLPGGTGASTGSSTCGVLGGVAGRTFNRTKEQVSMQRIRNAGVCLAAAFVLSGIATATASASAPEFGRCVAQAGGKFAEGGCKTKASAGKEKFEWISGVVHNKMKGKLKEGVPTLETVGGTKITCKGLTYSGVISNPKEVASMVFKFTGCSTSELPCQSGATSGEVVSASLGGQLGIEKVGETAAKDKVALELHGPGGGNLFEFECAGLKVIVHGSVLFNVLANKMVLTSTLKMTASKGEQKPDKFAGGPTDQHTLESSTAGGPFEEAGLTMTDLTEFEEKIEVSSVN